MKEKIFDGDFLKKLETLTLSTGGLFSEGSMGGRKSKARGSSVEFSDFREYSLGDDFRRIDWNAYGRFDKLFVKLFMEEREAHVNIFIDCSKSMEFGQPSKAITALRLSAVFTYLCLSNLDRVYLNRLSGDELGESGALSGKGAMDKALYFLQNTEFYSETYLAEALKKKKLTSRGISIIISDFFSPEVKEGLNYLLYKKQQVILLQLLSDEEIHPKLNGQLSLLDSESNKEIKVMVTPSLIKKYEERLLQFSTALQEYIMKRGGHYLLLNSSSPLEEMIFHSFTAEGILR